MEQLPYNHNACDVEVQLNENSGQYIGQSFTISIYAANQYCDEVSKDLIINVLADENHQLPVIYEGNKVLELIAGGSGTATFIGQNIKFWSWGTKPDFVKAIELNYRDNPNVCEVFVDVKDGASVRQGDITLYAFNEAGEISEPRTLTVNIIANSDHEAAIIDEDESISITHGGTATAVFTGTHIRSWGHATLPDAIKDIDMNYDTNPNRCEVLVTASSTATADNTPVEIKIYAYNKVGESADATLTVSIQDGSRSSSHHGCDVGFAGMSALILSMMFFRAKDKK